MTIFYLSKHQSKRIFFFALMFMITSMATTFAQKVKGKVTDDKGQGIPGTNILVKGTSTGATSDANGFYSVNAPKNATLIISSVGFITKEVAVENRSTVDVTLASDVKSLDEVVVVGYGTQKKSQMTGAISSVTSKQITEMPITNLGQAMQGRVAGVDVAQSGSKPGTVPKAFIS